MSALVDFVKSCAKLPTGNEFGFFIENSISNLHDANFENNKKELIKYLKAANKTDVIGTVAIGIAKCHAYCKEKTEKVESSKDDRKLATFINLLESISTLIEEVAKNPDEDDNESKPDDVEIVGNINTILESYDKKIEELQGKLEDVSKGIHEQNNIFDSKVFQLLINTVSILGIFVAIAFAGFGGASVLTNITFDFKEDFLCSVFLLILVALCIYNLILLLMYFIFVILRTFYSNNRFVSRFFIPTTWPTFKPLFIVDIIMFVALGILFFFVV